MSQSRNEPAVTPETINALVDALGALTMAITRQLPVHQREDFADSFERFARAGDRASDAGLRALLLELQSAARTAARHP
ncbi:MAG: hypothetical protein PGN26_13165 [Xylophilus ampelinus]